MIKMLTHPNWRERFDKEIGPLWNPKGNALLNSKVKAFIQTTLTETLERAIKEIDAGKRTFPERESDEYDTGFKLAKEEDIKILAALKEEVVG